MVMNSPLPQPPKSPPRSDLIGTDALPPLTGSDRWLGTSTLKLSLLALTVGLIVLAVSVGLDLLLLRDRIEPARRLMELSDGFAAVVIASLFFIYGRLRRRELLRRVE